MRITTYVIALLAFVFLSNVHAYDDDMLLSYKQADTKKSAQYAAAAYCAKKGLENWSCPACKAYPIPELTQVTVLQSSDGAFQGYVGKAKTANEIVVAFRGSRNIQNWIANLQSINQVQYSYKGCTGCAIAEGFYKSAYLVLATQLKNAMNKFNNKSIPVRVTGHSLGGAMAAIAAYELKADGYNVVNVHTVGSPRVGNPAYAKRYRQLVQGVNMESTLRLSTEQVILNAYKETMEDLADAVKFMTPEEKEELSPFLASALETYLGAAHDDTLLSTLVSPNGATVWRVVNGHDPVPRLPPRAFAGKYQHAPTEVWYKDQVNPRVCNDKNDEDPNCSLSVLLPVNVQHHMVYIGVRLNQHC